MDIHMNAGKARFDREKRLWTESRERELQLVDNLLAPWVKQRIADGIPPNEMLEHDSIPELLDAVAQWCQEYTRWREGCGLAFIEGYPVESWAGQVPAERRAAVLFRIANHIHGQDEIGRAWRLRRWAIQSLLDEYQEEQRQTPS